ncbi:hypothetical protein [Nocardia miyunensis]|uniref:hypothetical protein n=1 Tax=Nocardia miyunensis TaxID=282684 RepID=UPI0012F4BE7A|nr:hypothetical protein [Nocardia miyunensis]
MPLNSLPGIVVLRGGKGCRRLVVEPVHPDRCRVDLVVLGGLEVGVLISLDEQPVILVDHQPKQRALELIKHRISIASSDPDVGSAFIEPVEGIVNLSVDSACGAGVPADIDDGKTVHVLSPTGDNAKDVERFCSGVAWIYTVCVPGYSTQKLISRS